MLGMAACVPQLHVENVWGNYFLVASLVILGPVMR